MYSAFDRTKRAFALILIFTLVLAFAPRSLLGWTSDFAEIVRVPTRPFTHLGVKLSTWFRPPQIIRADVPEEAREIVEHLEIELERFQQLYFAEQMENQGLRQTLEQIQRARVDSNIAVKLLTANITARTPSNRYAPMQLNRGSSYGVVEGSIALYNGVHLIGRIGDVTPIGCTMIPLVNRSTGFFSANLIPPNSQDFDPTRNIQLEVKGDGTFVADVDERLNVLVGDIAVMADSTWPDTARGMTIGFISAINDIEELPLRKRLVITPRFYAHELSKVTLKIEEDEMELAGALNSEINQ